VDDGKDVDLILYKYDISSLWFQGAALAADAVTMRRTKAISIVVFFILVIE